MNKLKVAVFPAGTEIGLEINTALKNVKNVELYGLTSEQDHSHFVYKNIYGILNVSDLDFIEYLNKFISENKIDILFPAHDLVLDKLAGINLANNCKIITHHQKTVEICRDKLLTYQLFPEISPKISGDYLKNKQFPLYAKPRNGFGSKNNYLITNINELKNFVLNNNIDDYVVCEYLNGHEYTIDCFTNSDGKLIVCSPRQRNRIKNGIAVNSRFVFNWFDEKQKEFLKIANTINNKLGFNGPWFVQVKRNADGELKLLEIAPRIAGTSGLTRANGNNLPLMAIYNAIGCKVESIDNNAKFATVDRALSSKYHTNFDFKKLYVDLDDTLIINGKANAELLMLLYQCKNKGKNIALITRNAGNVEKILYENCIHIDLFDIINQVDFGEKKSDFIDKTVNTVFIDDSFSERKEVRDNSKITMVLDVNEASCLIDWKS